MKNKDKTVIYKSYRDIYSAIYERDFLRANGIESFLSEDTMLPLDPILTDKNWGIKLYVFQKDIPEIERLLAEIANEDSEEKDI